LAINKSPITLS